jgi:hypothetical protein
MESYDPTLELAYDNECIDVIFDWSHSFGDGTSGKIFHETLLRELNKPDAQPVLTNHVLKIPPTASSLPPPAEELCDTRPVLSDGVLKIPPTAPRLPPPIEKLCKFPVTAKYTIATAWKELRPPVLSSTLASQAHWAPPCATPYKTQFRMFDVEAETLQSVLAACRVHKTTLTGLLHALVLVSLASHVKPCDAKAFAGNTALDLRRHVESRPGLDPKRTMGNYVSMTSHEFDADLVRKIREAAFPSADLLRKREDVAPALVDFVWQCAARVRAEIQKRLDQGLKNDVVGLMKLVPDWRTQLRNEVDKPRPYSFVVTNLGTIDGAAREKAELENGSKPESWEIEYSVFAISAEVCGAAFQVSPISVKGKALCVSCSWQNCVVDVKIAEAIVVDLERWLRFLGKP